MKPSPAKTAGIDALTLLGLLKLAAAYKGLNLREGASNAQSEPIKGYILDERLLATLSDRGINQRARPDCMGRIFTLVDENPQEKVSGYAPSNGWNFKLLEGDEPRFDLRVELNVGFGVNVEKRGVVFMPWATGSYASPADRLPNYRMFKALVENDDDAPAVAKELAASDGSIIVTWTELGLGGIRRLADLFAEFAARNEVVVRLGRAGGVFNPAPFSRLQQPGNALFIPEPAQPTIVESWREQLNAYRASLVA